MLEYASKYLMVALRFIDGTITAEEFCGRFLSFRKEDEEKETPHALYYALGGIFTAIEDYDPTLSEQGYTEYYNASKLCLALKERLYELLMIMQPDIDMITDFKAANYQSVNESPTQIFHRAVMLGDMALVERLLDETPELVNTIDDDASFPLGKAAKNGDVGTATILIEHGANVNATNEFGAGYALIAASLGGHLAVVQLLLEHGADIHFNISGPRWTPLHCAAWRGHTELVSFLIDEGADPARKDSLGKAPWQIAFEMKHLETLGEFCRRQLP